MGRVVPSDICRFIRESCCGGRSPVEGQDKPLEVGSNRSAAVRAILDLTDELPPELLPTIPGHYTEFVTARAALRDAVQRWAQGDKAPLTHGSLDGHENPLRKLYRVLEDCPDSLPSPQTRNLSFIADPETKEALRLDVDSVNRALEMGEWKAATVLAGSVVEALLLWALQNRRATEVEVAVSARGSKFRTKNPDGRATLAEQLPYQDLHWFIEIGAEAGVIGSDTKKAVELAKDFRNLIHPGRVKREERACDRGTALSAVAALEHVAGEFQRRFDANTPI